MTDAQYWSIANALPKRILNGIYVVDWRTKIPGCDPTLQQACEFVLGFNPLSGCWIDPGAQYVARPSPYPSPSSWGVSLCNPPITQPPPTGGGTTTIPPSGGGITTGGGGSNTPPVTATPPSWPGINTTFVMIAIAGVALLFFMRK
jgi:hypothetical protein